MFWESSKLVKAEMYNLCVVILFVSLALAAQLAALLALHLDDLRSAASPTTTDKAVPKLQQVSKQEESSLSLSLFTLSSMSVGQATVGCCRRST
jgi:hypothetical protein